MPSNIRLPRKPSIHTLLLASIAAGLLAILGSGYWLTRIQLADNMLLLSKEELSAFGDSLRLHIVHLMRSGADDKALEAELVRTRRSNPELLELRLLHAPVITKQFGLHVDEQPRDALEHQALVSGQSQIQSLSGEQGRTSVHFVYPFKAESSCLACHTAELGMTLGAISITLDTSNIMQHLNNSQRDMLIQTIVEALLLFALLAYLLYRLLFRPLGRLQRGAEQLAAGDLGVQVEGTLGRELNEVIAAFNLMARKQRQVLLNLDQDLREHEEQLAHMVETSQLLESSGNLDEMLLQLARAMTESVKVTYGRILLLGEQGDSLLLHAAYPIREFDAFEAPSCARASCPLLFGIIDDGKPRLLHRDDVKREDERQLLLLNGTQWVLALPVVHQGKVLGLVLLNEFRAEEREPLDARKMRVAQAMTQELAAAIANAKLNEQLRMQLEEAVFAMAEAVDKKSPWTSGHSHRVADHARAIGEVMGLPGNELDDLYRAGLLHDIGKIGTPGSVLNKEGPLLDEEFALLKRHPADGGEILGKMHSFMPLIPAIRHHHEHYNGSGYPDGLAGEAIPLHARIIAVADAFDAMVSDRPYRAGMQREEAVRRLLAGAGSQFDQHIVDAFRRSPLASQ